MGSTGSKNQSYEEMKKRSLTKSKDVFMCKYDLEKSGTGLVQDLHKLAGHYSIRVDGREFEQTRDGVLVTDVRFREDPKEIVKLGTTRLHSLHLEQKVKELKAGPFAKYSLTGNNCIEFCNEMSTFLVKKPIPDQYREVVPDVKRKVALNSVAYVGIGTAVVITTKILFGGLGSR